jgi:hypothetical protein
LKIPEVETSHSLSAGRRHGIGGWRGCLGKAGRQLFGNIIRPRFNAGESIAAAGVGRRCEHNLIRYIQKVDGPTREARLARFEGSVAIQVVIDLAIER